MTFRRGFLSNLPAMLHRHSQPMTLAISFPDCRAWTNLSGATFSTFSTRPVAIENAPPKFSASTARLSTAWRRDLKSNLDCKPQQREISHTWKQCHTWSKGSPLDEELLRAQERGQARLPDPELIKVDA